MLKKLSDILALEKQKKNVILHLTEPFLQVFSNNDYPRCVTVILRIK